MFSGCVNLEGNINLPSSLKYIGYGAFTGCSKLTGDLNLENVEHIGNQAFNGCTGLNGSLKMNLDGASIGVSAFRLCSDLKGKAIIISLDGVAAFESCGIDEVEIKEGITTIPGSSFKKCNNIKKL